jgi:ribosome recycling factor
MAYDFKLFEGRIKEITDRLGKELSGIRTGRAALAILDDVKVESYGSMMPINQVAGISIEDPRTIRVAPWDASLSKGIEKAIIDANLGVSTGVDDKGVRVFFPEPTAERRQQLVKIAKEKVEEIRAELRRAREEVWSDIQTQEKDGVMSEDEKFRSKDEMQKRVDAANASFEAALERKEKEITS